MVSVSTDVISPERWRDSTLVTRSIRALMAGGSSQESGRHVFRLGMVKVHFVVATTPAEPPHLSARALCLLNRHGSRSGLPECLEPPFLHLSVSRCHGLPVSQLRLDSWSAIVCVRRLEGRHPASPAEPGGSSDDGARDRWNIASRFTTHSIRPSD